MLSGENPIRPAIVQKCRESKFGDALEDVSNAMQDLANPLPPSELAPKAYTLCKRIQVGDSSWQKKGRRTSGKMDLGLIRKITPARR